MKTRRMASEDQAPEEDEKCEKSLEEENEGSSEHAQPSEHEQTPEEQSSEEEEPKCDRREHIEDVILGNSSDSDEAQLLCEIYDIANPWQNILYIEGHALDSEPDEQDVEKRSPSHLSFVGDFPRAFYALIQKPEPIKDLQVLVSPEFSEDPVILNHLTLLSTFQRVTHLDFLTEDLTSNVGQQFRRDAVCVLRSLLPQLVELQKLTLSQGGRGVEHMQNSIIDCLSHLPKLTDLELDSPAPVAEPGWELLQSEVRVNGSPQSIWAQNMTRLVIREAQQFDLHHICKVLPFMPQLEELQISAPQGHDASFSGVAQLNFLTCMTSLTSLELAVKVGCHDYALENLGDLLSCLQELECLKLEIIRPVPSFNAAVLEPYLTGLTELDSVWYCLKKDSRWGKQHLIIRKNRKKRRRTRIGSSTASSRPREKCKRRIQIQEEVKEVPYVICDSSLLDEALTTAETQWDVPNEKAQEDDVSNRELTAEPQYPVIFRKLPRINTGRNKAPQTSAAAPAPELLNHILQLALKASQDATGAVKLGDIFQDPQLRSLTPASNGHASPRLLRPKRKGVVPRCRPPPAVSPPQDSSVPARSAVHRASPSDDAGENQLDVASAVWGSKKKRTEEPNTSSVRTLASEECPHCRELQTIKT